MNGIGAEALTAAGDLHTAPSGERRWTTPGGIPIHFHIGQPPSGPAVADLAPLRLHWHSLVVYWNPLTKAFDPIRCATCGQGAYSLAFTNDRVDALCAACSK